MILFDLRFVSEFNIFHFIFELLFSQTHYRGLFYVLDPASIIFPDLNYAQLSY